MKIFLILLCIAAGLVLCRANSPLSAQEPDPKKPSSGPKVAVVDVDRLFTDHPKHKLMVKDVDALRVRLNAQDVALLTAVNELGFAADAASKNGDRDKALALQQKRYEAEKGWLLFRAKVKADVEKLTNDRREELMLEVKKAVRDYAIKQRIDVVFPYKGEPPVYAAPGVDITEAVTALLRRKM